MSATTSRARALTLTIPAAQTRAAQLVLEPYLLRDTELPAIAQPSPAERSLSLHPRVGSASELPEEVARACVELGGRWGARDLELSPRERARLFTVVFFSKSKPAPALAPQLPATWRRVLSNFHAAELSLDGARYASVEHYFQGQKALCSTRPEMAPWFTRDWAGPEAVGEDPGAAKKAGGRGAYKRAGASLNTEAWLARRVPAMRAAIEARWAQQPLFRAVLASTRGLDLLHFERSGARSFWGGSLGREHGMPQGENCLGTLLMQRRDASR